MKKTFLIGVLAALMLFAFTACENSAPTSPIYGKDILGVSPVTVPDYIEGETLDPADVTLKVLFDDDTSANFTGTELNLTKATGMKLAAGTNVFTATFNGKTFNVNIPAYKPELVTFNVSGIKQDYISLESDATIDLEGITVTVTYNNGKTKEATDWWFVDRGEHDYLLSTDITDIYEDAGQPLKKNDTLTVPDNLINAYLASNPTLKGYALEGTKTFKIVDEANPVTITDVEVKRVLKYTDADSSTTSYYEIFRVGTKNTLANFKFDMTITFSDGTKRVIKNYGTDFASASNAGVSAVGTFTITEDQKPGAGDWTITLVDYDIARFKFDEKTTKANVVIEAKNGDFTATSAAFSVESIEDYPVAITATIKKDGTDESAKDITYAEGVDVKVSDFTYTVAGTVAWASGEKYTEPEKAPVKVDTPSYYETDSFAPIGSDEDTFTVEITYVGPGSDNAQPVVVTVADEVGITQPASDEN